MPNAVLNAEALVKAHRENISDMQAVDENLGKVQTVIEETANEVNLQSVQNYADFFGESKVVVRDILTLLDMLTGAINKYIGDAAAINADSVRYE